jgi:anti-anti-sigma regulatory factor
MFDCTVHGTPTNPVIALHGDLTLENCRQILTVLREHLALATAASIDLADTTSSDLSFIQILASVAKISDKQVSFAPLPTHLFETAAMVGAGDLIKQISNTES